MGDEQWRGRGSRGAVIADEDEPVAFLPVAPTAAAPPCPPGSPACHAPPPTPPRGTSTRAACSWRATQPRRGGPRPSRRRTAATPPRRARSPSTTPRRGRPRTRPCRQQLRVHPTCPPVLRRNRHRQRRQAAGPHPPLPLPQVPQQARAPGVPQLHQRLPPALPEQAPRPANSSLAIDRLSALAADSPPAAAAAPAERTGSASLSTATASKSESAMGAAPGSERLVAGRSAPARW